MRAIAQWRHLMISTVTIAPRTTVDVNHLPTYGTAVPYKAKIYYGGGSLEAMRSGTAQLVEPARVMHIDSADPILPTSQVTLSTSDVGSTENWAIHPVIKNVKRLYDADGPHSTIVELV